MDNASRKQHNIYEQDSIYQQYLRFYKVNNRIIHHFDLYRLESAEEIEDIGFMEYIDSGDTCFIEWPEKIAEFLPTERIHNIDISISLNECREYTFS